MRFWQGLQSEQASRIIKPQIVIFVKVQVWSLFVKKLSIMGLTITRQEDASQTRGLSKDGSGAKPRGQEVFYWMHGKRRARYNLCTNGNGMVE